MVESNTNTDLTREDMWNLNNYILLKDYYDRTISRIAARCIRQGNIAIEDYKFYGYILDVLEEICDVGDYIISKDNLHPYIEKKIAGGVKSLKKDLKDYHDELVHNSSPDMIREDSGDIEKMKKALGIIEDDDKEIFDPTKGAGMSTDDIIDRIMRDRNAENNNNNNNDE